MRELPSLKKINKVCSLADFDETWPEHSSDINADKRVGLLRNPKYFSCDFSARDYNRIPTNIQLKKKSYPMNQ